MRVPTPGSDKAPNSWRHIADGAAGLDPPRPEADRVTFGKLLEHGPAKHLFRPSAQISYFVRIETTRGERVFWSPGLKSAMAQSQSRPQVGDEVGVRENSIEPVTLITRVRDTRGNTVGERRFDTPRVHWRVEKRSFFDEQMLAAEALRNEKVHPREAVKTYPDLLPAYITLDSARKVAQERIPAAHRARFVQLVRETLAHAIERAEPLPSVGLRGATPQSKSSVAREVSRGTAEGLARER